MKSPEQADSSVQKADAWLPKVVGKGEMGRGCLMGTGFPFGVNENILKYTQHVGILLDRPKSSFDSLYDVMEWKNLNKLFCQPNKYH